MSVKVMSDVWQSSQSKGTARLVLLAIADHCNPSGIAWPSLTRLASYVNVDRRNVIHLAEGFARRRVGQVHFDNRHLAGPEGVMQGHRCMCEGSGIEDEDRAIARGFLHPVHQFALMIGLARLKGHAASQAAQAGMDIFECFVAVNLRLARTEQVEVWPTENIYRF